jgi:ribosomal protein S18 acetylase RimI-like enzyme
MQIHSLGYQTDLIFSRFSGEVVDKGNYTVIRTPSNPTFWYGNYVLFPSPPEPGNSQVWMDIFTSEHPNAKHAVIGWDGIDGERGAAKEFEALGFTISENVILTSSKVHTPPKINTNAEYRPILEEADWAQTIRLWLDTNERHEPEGYEIFARRKLQAYQQMTEAGLGNWWGAFLNGTMVAGLGLFLEDGIGRFQSVDTHPEYRRRGLCGTLVYTAAKHALEEQHAKVLVMCADPEYHAAKIYESVGFKPTETQINLEREPREDQEFRNSR